MRQSASRKTYRCPICSIDPGRTPCTRTHEHPGPRYPTPRVISPMTPAVLVFPPSHSRRRSILPTRPWTGRRRVGTLWQIGGRVVWRMTAEEQRWQDRRRSVRKEWWSSCLKTGNEWLRRESHTLCKLSFQMEQNTHARTHWRPVTLLLKTARKTNEEGEEAKQARKISETLPSY